MYTGQPVATCKDIRLAYAGSQVRTKILAICGLQFGENLVNPVREPRCALVTHPLVVQSAPMGAGETPQSNGRLRPRTGLSAAEVSTLSQLEQVAAVCYRLTGSKIELLLVKTRRGRWTFPKGGSEFGLSGPQAAAVEALEEAGAQGSIEEVAFARYRRGKPALAKDSAVGGKVVHAYLLEVEHSGKVREPNRSPTWFSPERAKREMRDDRHPANAAELGRVIDLAVRRIRRLHISSRGASDSPPKVTFERPREGLL